MATSTAVKKVQVVLIKSRSASGTEDISKMTTHLEGVLAEKEGVDLKSRIGLTDATLKSSDFIVFCGYDLDCLSELFKVLSYIESLDDSLPAPKIFLYEEPGQSIREDLERFILKGIDLRRMKSKTYGLLIDSWTYRDIAATVEIEVRKRAIGRNSENPPAAE